MIEKNGTGITGMIEKNGTGVSADSMIEKSGTGVRMFPKTCALVAAMLASPMLMASDFSGMVNLDEGRVSLSVTDGQFLFAGAGRIDGGYAMFQINSLDFSALVQAEGSGTGVSAEGSGTGVAAEGSGTGVKAEGSGTGVAAEGSGTGLTAEGSGTGVTAEGSGTGVAAEGSGTGVSAEGSGTGVARVCIANHRLLAEGSGTGVAAEGSGTGLTAEGSGTGLTAEGSGTGLTAEGSGTGIAAEGSGTGITSFSYSATLPIDGRDISLNPGNCGPGSVLLSFGLAELALNGDTASVLLYGVAGDGRVFEIGAAELPVVFQ